MILLVCCFTMVGMGNGALFQLVPLRWPATAAVAGSMIGEIGALGGVILPFALTYSSTHFKTYAYGFIAYAGTGGAGARGAAHRATVSGSASGSLRVAGRSPPRRSRRMSGPLEGSAFGLPDSDLEPGP